MESLANVFKALSEETRLAMVGLLLNVEELCVCDFVEVLGITQSKASRHLRCLVHAGLLQDRREAVWVHYRIADVLGEPQRVIIEGLRHVLIEQTPASLLVALDEWRKQKAGGGRCYKSY
jgi:ArsR family transcriptional regulator, arsenate/arsenite/antimonite-responsive transcriptional repressor